MVFSPILCTYPVSVSQKFQEIKCEKGKTSFLEFGPLVCQLSGAQGQWAGRAGRQSVAVRWEPVHRPLWGAHAHASSHGTRPASTRPASPQVSMLKGLRLG